MNTRKLLCICILNLIHLLNYIDRYTISGVLRDVICYYNISNQMAGLLQTVFIISFMTIAPFCGYLGDRFNRKFIILVGLVIWVCAVLGSSFIPRKSFWAFITLRGIIGIGEASYVVIAPTMISDMYVGNMRSRMLMIFYLNIPIGSGLGYIIGSQVTSLAKGGQECLDCWQWGVRVTPVFGVICMITLLLFIREPVRGEAEREANPLISSTSYDSNKKRTPTSITNHLYNFYCDVRYLITNPTFVWSTIGYTAVVFVTGTLAWWSVIAIQYANAKDDSTGTTMQPTTTDKINQDQTTLFGNVTGTTMQYTSACSVSPDKDSSSTIFGVITIFAGLFGVSTGSIFAMLWKSGKLCLKASPKADPIVSAFGSFLAAPLMFLAFYLIPKNLYIAWTIIFFTILCLCLNWAINTDMLMNIVVPERRSIASAVQILISHLFGDAAGPYIVGAISDLALGSNPTSRDHFDALIKAFYLPNALLLLSGAAFVIAAFTLPTALRRVAESTTAIAKTELTPTETAREPEPGVKTTATAIPIEGNSTNELQKPVIDQHNGGI